MVQVDTQKETKKQHRFKTKEIPYCLEDTNGWLEGRAAFKNILEI